MLHYDLKSFGRGWEINAELLSVIIDSALQLFDSSGYADETDVGQHLMLKFSRMVLDYEPDLSMFKKRIGLYSFDELMECLINLDWQHEDKFMGAYLDMLYESSTNDICTVAA